MQIPNIRNFVASRVDYFLQSSWKGKTVHVLCAASILTLIYCIAFRKKTPPEGPDRSSPIDRSRVRRKPPAQSKEPPKPDLSYIKTVVEEPDFVKGYQSEFGAWLSDQMESYKSWFAMAQDSSRQAAYFVVLRRFIPELKAQVAKMIPVFQALPHVNSNDWGEFLLECDAIAGLKISSTDSCAKLKTCLDKLLAWKGVLQREHQRQFVHQVGDVKNHPHYEFTNFQTQYFHYLGLYTKEDFSKLLATDRPYLATVGLLEMEDVDCLQLRTMLPSIERLRLIFCFLTITGDETALRPLINAEIDKCRDVLTSSDNLSDELKNGQELKDHVKLMRGLFGNLSRNLAQGLTLLKEIEQKDIARQLILLRGYIHQQDLRAAWVANNDMGFTRLALYAQGIETTTLKFFYQMGR